MGELSFEKLIVIAVVILIIFGSKKIPEMMRGLGKGVREFNDAKKGLSDDLNATKNSVANKENTKSSSITDVEHESVNAN
ncbi:MAG: twin-arginine translocase TatA/TatE family subunit [Arachidicoccus sp.]|nr:twin-arginine translocase TatA/TatE family subunit [Arachidicoccus sp.]